MMKVFAITVVIFWFALVEIRFSFLFGVLLEQIEEKEKDHDTASR